MSALLRHSHASREHIRAFQDHHVRRLVTHAYENVPYYRRLFDQHGVKPGDIRGAADLPRIPITSKRALQSLPVEEIVARGIDPTRLVTHRTSGSSGEPFTIRRTWFEERLLGLLRLRATHDLGQRLTDRTAAVVLARPPHPRDNQLPLRIFQSLGLYRKLQIDCLLPSEDILRALRDFRPDVLSGFAGVLARLAQTVSGDDCSVIRPRFVAVGGEVLTPLMRRHITEAFAAPVFNLYASHEFNVIAWECRETGELHTSDDSVIVEVLKDGRLAAEGERGEVVGTNLHAWAMPFIRYRLDDIVVKGSETCRCGRPFSTIRTVQGRMIDYFLLPDGRALHPYEIVVPLIDISWIRQYQLVQEREDRVVLRVAPSFAPSSRQLASLEEAVSARLGQGVEFQVALVPEIQIEVNGKFWVSRSLVRSAYDGIDWDNPQTAISSPVGEHRG
jgi:phenylacetate-CoA ligase